VPSYFFPIGDTRILVAAGVWAVQDGIALNGTGIDDLTCGTNQGAAAYGSRHGQDYNVVFCDGHIKRINPTLLFNPAQTATQWNNDHKPHPETWNSSAGGTGQAD
jgi:prepilin-type processing-associated H-X9-DG protein